MLPLIDRSRQKTSEKNTANTNGDLATLADTRATRQEHPASTINVLVATGKRDDYFCALAIVVKKCNTEMLNQASGKKAPLRNWVAKDVPMKEFLIEKLFMGP